jgi:hypothetical protein
MKSQLNDSKGISEVVSVIFIILLVIALALVTYGMLSGWLNPKYMQKSVYIAASAKETMLSQGAAEPYHLLTFQPAAGDPFYINGQGTPTGTKTTMRIVSPDGRNLTPDASSLDSSLYGKMLFIYQKSGANACEFVVTDETPDVLKLPPMVIGRYDIQLIDENIHVLASTYTTNITKGTTSVPVTTLTGTGTGVGYKSDCSFMNGTCPKGCPLLYNTSPCNRTYSKYNGSTYLTFPDDPTLKYTGDLTISASIKPTATGSMSNPSNWHQIVGKGIIYPNNTEVDNYQLFQVGDKILFEWNDKTTGVHYQGITTTAPVTTAWSDVTVTVSNGDLKIYYNGVSQNLVYNRGTDPRSITTPVPNPPKVRLMDTSNPVNVGKQNGSTTTNDFNFVGNIGPVSLYNRALSQTEITNAVCV